MLLQDTSSKQRGRSEASWEWDRAYVRLQSSGHFDIPVTDLLAWKGHSLSPLGVLFLGLVYLESARYLIATNSSPMDSNKEDKRASGAKADEASSTAADGQAQLTAAIEQLLNTVGQTFKTTSAEIMNQSMFTVHFVPGSWIMHANLCLVDAMAERLDELEAQAKAAGIVANKQAENEE